jgi:hypothetical protein
METWILIAEIKHLGLFDRLVWRSESSLILDPPKSVSRLVNGAQNDADFVY